MPSPRQPALLPWLAASCLAVGCIARTPSQHYLAEEPAPRRGLAYPPARRAPVVDVYHGYRVEDPYRWLEEPDNRESRAWVASERALLADYLGDTSSRERIRQRLEQLWDHPRRDLPVVQGGRLFYLEHGGLEEQPLLLTAEHVGGRARVLLDANALSREGTASLVDFAPSPGGGLVAFATSESGSDWRTWRVLEVDTGRLREDRVTRNKLGGLAWAHDESGFFYPGYERPAGDGSRGERDTSPEVRFHLLGTDEEQDLVVVPRPSRPGLVQGFDVSDDGSALVVWRRDVDLGGTELDLVPLEPAGPPEILAGWTARRREASARVEAVPLARGYDATYRFLGGGANRVWVLTDLEAPRWKVISIDPARPERRNWLVVVPEDRNPVQTADLVGGRLVVTYMRDATSLVEVYDPSGTHLHTVDLPGVGTVEGFRGDAEDRSTFFAFTSFTSPPVIHSYDLEHARDGIWFAPDLDFDAEDYETRQVFYPSKDSTLVPMFLTSRKGLELDGDSPTWLYGDGGFGVPVTPFFSVPNLLWLEMGGVLAVPNLRGGGEYGRSWHLAGARLLKQNTFDDFVAAAEYLIREGCTRPEKLAIGGSANGGLLVGACLTQRPELFAAAVPEVGVLDMLRYHLFTRGWSWADEYGTSADPADFRALLEYSPVHNVRPGTRYPATLVMTSDRDERVVPAHSFKFAAALQDAQAGEAPILVRIEEHSGRGAGTPTSEAIEAAADRIVFLRRELGEE